MVGSCSRRLSPPARRSARPPACGLCAKLLGILMVNPLTTVSQGFTSCSGASCSLSVHALPVPVVAGTHRSGMMPLPKNHVPKRPGQRCPAA